MKRQLLKFLPLIILVIGAGVFLVLVASGRAPEHRVMPDYGPLVETLAAPTQTVQVIVEAQGSVQASEEIDLVPQVSGVIVWKTTQMEVGGFFARGEVLLHIDPRDYELAVTGSEAAVARARYQLDLAVEEAAVARQEWEMVRQHRELEAEPNDLVLRLPQVRAAEAELLAAEAGLAEARLRLGRTQIVAPFDGRVRASSLDVGQYVVANQPVSRIYSIEQAEIVVAVLGQDMEWLTIPQRLPDLPMPLSMEQTATDIQQPVAMGEGPPAAAPLTAAPRARVHTEFAGRRHTWEGFISRSLAELDARSRMLGLVIEVDAPYAAGVNHDTPLLVGMFVDVEILGSTVDEVRVLPRVALHEGDVVWVAQRDGTLDMRHAQVVRVRDEEVLVRLDLADDERIVISQLGGATQGMKIRALDEESPL
jgi:RND family efflux transporter MFP subunit